MAKSIKKVSVLAIDSAGGYVSTLSRMKCSNRRGALILEPASHPAETKLSHKEKHQEK